MDAGCVSRPRVIGGGKWHDGPSSVGANCVEPIWATRLRSLPHAGLRSGTGRVPRRGQPDGPADSCRACRGSSVWSLPAERLVGTRYTELGVSTARAVSGEELRDVHFALGGNAGRAGAISLCRAIAAGGRPPAVAASFF